MAATLQAVSDKVSIIPGNSLGQTWLPNFLKPSETVKVGEGTSQVTWTDWVSDVSNKAFALVNPGAAIMKTAVEIGRDTGSETASFVRSVSARAVGAVTGVGAATGDFLGGLRDTVKYLAYGLIAVAVIYVLVVFVAPVSAMATAGKK